MDKIIIHWEKAFYTPAFTLLFAIIALFISVYKWNSNRILNPLFYYFLTFTLSQILVLFEQVTEHKYDSVTHIVFYYMDLLITILEVFIFVRIIKYSLAQPVLIKLINPLPFIFLIYLLIMFLFKGKNGIIGLPFLQIVFTFQAFFLIIPCIVYYIDLFKKQPSFELANEPTFWIVTGLSFCMICTLPFSIFGQVILDTNKKLYLQLFSIFNVFYSILFIMIIRAYLCRPQMAR